ncbi:RNA helicase, partial [Cupriavidus sp. HMR-1]
PRAAQGERQEALRQPRPAQPARGEARNGNAGGSGNAPRTGQGGGRGNGHANSAAKGTAKGNAQGNANARGANPRPQQARPAQDNTAAPPARNRRPAPQAALLGGGRKPAH